MTATTPVRNPLMDLPPMPDTAPPVLAPGLLQALGITPRAIRSPHAGADFGETYEELCQRISQEAAS